MSVAAFSGDAPDEKGARNVLLEKWKELYGNAFLRRGIGCTLKKTVKK
jgi:hypothetical protein